MNQRQHGHVRIIRVGNIHTTRESEVSKELVGHPGLQATTSRNIHNQFVL